MSLNRVYYVNVAMLSMCGPLNNEEKTPAMVADIENVREISMNTIINIFKFYLVSNKA